MRASMPLLALPGSLSTVILLAIACATCAVAGRTAPTDGKSRLVGSHTFDTYTDNDSYTQLGGNSARTGLVNATIPRSQADMVLLWQVELPAVANVPKQCFTGAPVAGTSESFPRGVVVVWHAGEAAAFAADTAKRVWLSSVAATTPLLPTTFALVLAAPQARNNAGVSDTTGGDLVVGVSSRSVIALRLADGHVAWRCTTCVSAEATSDVFSCSHPAYDRASGMVYVASAKSICAIDVSSGAVVHRGSSGYDRPNPIARLNDALVTYDDSCFFSWQAGSDPPSCASTPLSMGSSFEPPDGRGRPAALVGAQGKSTVALAADEDDALVAVDVAEPSSELWSLSFDSDYACSNNDLGGVSQPCVAGSVGYALRGKDFVSFDLGSSQPSLRVHPLNVAQRIGTCAQPTATVDGMLVLAGGELGLPFVCDMVASDAACFQLSAPSETVAAAGQTSSTVAVAVSRIFVRTDGVTGSPGALYVFGSKRLPPPAGLQVSSGDGALVVSWDPPSQGYPPFDSFDVSAWKSNASFAAGSPGTTSVSVQRGAASVVLHVPDASLDPGYFVAMRAIRSDEIGDWSALVGPVLACVPPARPTVVSLHANGGSATVTWRPSSALNAVPTTGFVVSASPASTSVPVISQKVPFVPGCNQSATIEPLVNGVRYSVAVAAENLGGLGNASLPRDCVPAGVPGPPQAPRASTVSQTTSIVSVDWLPAVPNGSEVVAYTAFAATASAAPDVVSVVSVTGNPPGISALFTNLTEGLSVQFRVTATNAVGISPPSEWTDALVVPHNAGHGSGSGWDGRDGIDALETSLVGAAAVAILVGALLLDCKSRRKRPARRHLSLASAVFGTAHFLVDIYWVWVHRVRDSVASPDAELWFNIYLSATTVSLAANMLMTARTTCHMYRDRSEFKVYAEKYRVVVSIVVALALAKVSTLKVLRCRAFGFAGFDAPVDASRLRRSSYVVNIVNVGEDAVQIVCAVKVAEKLGHWDQLSTLASLLASGGALAFRFVSASVVGIPVLLQHRKETATRKLVTSGSINDGPSEYGELPG